MSPDKYYFETEEGVQETDSPPKTPPRITLPLVGAMPDKAPEVASKQKPSAKRAEVDDA